MPCRMMFDWYRPLARYVKLRVAHAPGMPGNFSPPAIARSDPGMHHDTYMTHVSWCMPGSLNCSFLWSWWRGKHSQHSRSMRNPQFYVSVKRTIAAKVLSGRRRISSGFGICVCIGTNCRRSKHCFVCYKQHCKNNLFGLEVWIIHGICYSSYHRLSHQFYKICAPDYPVCKLYRQAVTPIDLAFTNTGRPWWFLTLFDLLMIDFYAPLHRVIMPINTWLLSWWWPTVLVLVRVMAAG